MGCNEWCWIPLIYWIIFHSIQENHKKSWLESKWSQCCIEWNSCEFHYVLTEIPVKLMYWKVSNWTIQLNSTHNSVLLKGTSLYAMLLKKIAFNFIATSLNTSKPMMHQVECISTALQIELNANQFIYHGEEIHWAQCYWKYFSKFIFLKESKWIPCKIEWYPSIFI